MKNSFRNVLSNEENGLNENAKMRKITKIQRTVDQNLNSFGLTADYTIDSANISAALMGKTVVKDDENHRVLGITDDVIIEFDDRIMKGLTLTSQNILKSFRQKVETGIVRRQNISETLTYIEFTNAAFVDTLEFQQVKIDLNDLLAEMMRNGSPEYVQMVREGILEFFESSKNNIVRGRRKFKNVPYAIENSKEKEFFRAVFIAEMFEDKVFDYDFLEMSGEIDGMNFDIIDSIYRKSELFTPEQVSSALLTSRSFKSRDEILEYYLKKDKKYFVTFATSEEIANYIIDGRVSPRDCMKKIRLDSVKDFSPELLEKFLSVSNFPKGVEFIDYVQVNSKNEKYLSRNLLNKLDRDRFLKVILSEKIAKKYGNPYNSQDYIDEYGKLTSTDIINLNQAGLVNEEDIIKLVGFKSIQVQEPEEFDNMIKNLLIFYDLDRLGKLAKEGKITPKFAELYNDLLDNLATDEQRKLYFDKMNKGLQEKENSDEILTSLVQAGIKIDDSVEYEISEEFVSEKYLDDEISEKDVIELYEKGFISLDTIRVLYSDSELVRKYRDGELDYRVLNILENKSEIIKTELQSKRLKTFELIALYSKTNGLNIEELIKVTEGYDFGEEVLVDYISDEITPEKVEGLFNNYYISQDDLDSLVARKIITKEQAKKFAEKMATHEQYESLFSLDDRFITLTTETDGGNGGGGHGFGPGSKRPGQIKNDPELQELLLSQIGFDERTLTLQGTNNSLDGYKIYPSEEYGVMVFLKNDKPGNATYIMSLQQGLYFLNKIVRETKNKSGEKEVGIGLQSDATKKELRETEHVKIKNAAAGWGNNIVNSIKKLSSSFREKMSKQTEYRKIIEDVTEEIREDYIARLDRDDD